MKIKINPDYLQDDEIINLKNTLGCKSVYNKVQIFDYKSPKSSSAASYKKQIILYAYMVGKSQGWTNQQIFDNIECYIFFPFSEQKHDNDFDNMMASVKKVNYTVQDIEDVIKHDIAVVREADSVPWETVDLYGLGTYTKFSCSYCPYLGSIEDKNTGFSGCKCTYDMGFRQSRGLKFNLREGVKKEDQNDSK